MATNSTSRTVIITGASSGIARAAALTFAEKGFQVVVAARRKKYLDEVVHEIEAKGGKGLAVPTDVTDEKAVVNLAKTAIEHFGGFDVWVNAAAVYAVGTFTEIPIDVFRRVIEVNIMGYVHGSKAALTHFMKSGGKGTLINIASVVGEIPQPFVTPYTTSKFAVRGFTEALRSELVGTDIHVCTVLPATIDTPIYHHAANYSGKEINPLKPVYDPQEVANTIVDLADNPKREVTVGTAGKALTFFYKVSEGITERTFTEQVEHDHFTDEKTEDTSGNLFQPKDDGYTITGDWKGRS